MTSPPSAALPAQVQSYLEAPVLRPLWVAARSRLERNGLQATGTLKVDLDETAAAQLSGLLGVRVTAGPKRPVGLAELDAALRRSKAGRGLVSVLEHLDGRPLHDRTAARRATDEQWAQAWRGLDEALATAGLAGAPWVSGWIADLRRTGILTRAGADTAGRALACAASALGLLARTSATGLRTGFRTGLETGPETMSAGPFGGDDPVGWQIASLATATTGDAHGLDDSRLTAAAVLRAAAIASGRPAPLTSAQRRELWHALGVATDGVSGTVLVWSLRPPGDDAWSAMMRQRRDLGLVTHLTLHELGRAGEAALGSPEQTVSICENPQVLQAAARAGAPAPLICLSGSPAEVGTRLVQALVLGGVPVRYHGDFDWPGIAIAGRVLALGAVPWRLSASDYLGAAGGVEASGGVPLAGSPAATPWDPDLATAMGRTGVAVHEEYLLDILIADLMHDTERRSGGV
ncbi:hypothetical protein ACG83_20245 [Frankia sp. R43]|uniref:TIGR02679 domain-containing protein n=1 Tax=Frankia sp. R43 TaxID=269536 RepID=UPI0006CA5BEC|nr:TIGR02679 domain-containing protein [Frankia sp. R43]KPM54300.1 hypothetical protein ACG83_20245 [Frankia sp. R43]